MGLASGSPEAETPPGGRSAPAGAMALQPDRGDPDSLRKAVATPVTISAIITGPERRATQASARGEAKD